MVQGLAFLSKKSWHTKNLANQEKVWMAEQRKAAEESKTKELAKQIQQEREEDELDKIAGRSSKKRDRGIDWMYEGGRGEAAKEAGLKQNEEYLMGKEFQPQGKVGGDFVDLESGGVLNEVITKKPAAVENQVPEAAAAAPVNAEPSVADRNEAFRMRHEDPMFLVSRKHHEIQTQHEKKRALFERVVGPTQDKTEEDKEKRRHSQKERKRERKQRRPEEEGERGHRRHRHSRSKSRSNSRDRDHRRRHKKRHRSRSPSFEQRRSRSPGRQHNDEDRRFEARRRDRSRSRSHERRRYRSRSSSPRDYHRRRRSPPRRNDYDQRDRHEEQKPSHHRRHEERRQEESRHYPQAERTSRPEGYGLQGGKSVSSRSDGDLGPDRQLLHRKRQERDSERRRNRESGSSRRRMTEEERAAALQAMQRDASKRDELLNRAVAAKYRHNDDDEYAAPSSEKASFLQDMAEKTHGIREGSSLASRVAKNRHTNKKLSDEFL